MKKILAFVALICLIGISGCTPVEEGIYKEGTYYGTATDNYGGETNTATAIVYVDASGVIKSVTLDTTYVKDGVVTTKKSLGNEYGMKGVSASKGTIAGGAEWFEQVANLEKKIVSEQGLDWLVWSDTDNTVTDSVSGVTIKINALVEAANNAINQAK